MPSLDLAVHVYFLLKQLEDIEPTPKGEMTWGRCWGCEKGLALCPTWRKLQRYIYIQKPFLDPAWKCILLGQRKNILWQAQVISVFD
jgi:hypothetical protein